MIVLTTVSDVWFPLSLGVSYTVLFPSDFFFKLVQFVLAHMGQGQKKDQLQELLISGNFKVSFMRYNWDLNSKH